MSGVPGQPHPAPTAPDPAATGRTAWWIIGAVALVTGAFVGAALDITVSVGVGIGFAAGAAFARAGLLAPKVKAVVSRTDPAPLELRVSILGWKAMEPIWSRTQGVLRIGGGTTTLIGLDGIVVLSAPSSTVSFRAGSGWGKGGVWMETPGQHPARFSSVSGPDLAAWGAHYLIDKPLIDSLNSRARADHALR